MHVIPRSWRLFFNIIVRKKSINEINSEVKCVWYQLVFFRNLKLHG
ncbi:hypothetical protein SLEP1_g12508 [Rubroshorea leprosula]|uniref:Uncharacterized protein n=1 Tax=Rubroshorea leprosula TaxID=152421 RepID=A0AAV5IMK0_9ROSI|nr:hypothetical protein SLEP1_g12508 [Rubroshorea leprosula]